MANPLILSRFSFPSASLRGGLQLFVQAAFYLHRIAADIRPPMEICIIHPPNQQRRLLFVLYVRVCARTDTGGEPVQSVFSGYPVCQIGVSFLRWLSIKPLNRQVGLSSGHNGRSGGENISASFRPITDSLLDVEKETSQSDGGMDSN